HGGNRLARAGARSRIGLVGHLHRDPHDPARPDPGSARLTTGRRVPMLRPLPSLLKGALIALTAAWEIYAIRGVSEAGVGFSEVAVGVPSAVLLAVAWACAWSASDLPRRMGARRLLLGFPILAGALLVIYLSSQSPL